MIGEPLKLCRIDGCGLAASSFGDGTRCLNCYRGSRDVVTELQYRREVLGEVVDAARLTALPGYEQLAEVLDAALAQAQAGKGKERHAGEGEAFHDQQIVQLCEWMNSTQGAVFQVSKKALESTRLDDAAAERELLGAINYAAAAVLVIRRRRAASRKAT